MKTLGIALLWIVALLIALWLLLRARRGKPVVLRGRLKPRLARMVVVLLLALGVSSQTASAGDPQDAPAKKDQPAIKDPLPAVLDVAVMRRMRRAEIDFGDHRKRYAVWRLGKQGIPPPLKGARVPLPKRIATLLQKEFEAGHGALPATTPGELFDALTEAEKHGFISHFTVGLLWRWSARMPADAAAQGARIALFDALHTHARMANALIKAHADVKPIALPPRAWMSKAGPKREERIRENKFQKELLAAARKHYPTCDAAPWSTEASLGVLVRMGAQLDLRRGGKDVTVAPGKHATIGRLDLIDTRNVGPVVLEHAGIGAIALPGDRLFGLWDLADHLDAQARERVDVLVRAALLGDEQAAERIARALPLVYRALSKALTERPDAKGAPVLRVLSHALTD